MAKFLHNGPCEACGSRDNLAHYDDGSKWCWGCHYYERATNSPFVKERDRVENPAASLSVASDLCFDFPAVAVEWLAKYGISVEEAIGAHIMWSPSWEQLTFLFKDENNNVLFTQARNFNPERAAKRKYYNQGSPADVLPIFHTEGDRKRQLVVTEDVLSSLKIARQSDAMPALGTYLPTKKINALKALGYERLVVWLDSDKLKEAMEISTMAKWLGMSSKVVYTELDPKEYSNQEIKRYLE